MFKILKDKLLDEAGSDGGEAGGVAPVTDSTASTEPALPTGVTDPDASLDYDDISAMMNFDPFEDGAFETSAASENQSVADPAVPADVPPEAGGEVPAQPDPAAPAGEEPQVSPEMALMQQQLEAMRQQNTAMQQQLQQQQQAPAQSPGADPLDQFIPPYQFQIPEQMMDMMNSENPQERAQGVSMVLSAALRTAHKTMLQQVNGMMQTYVPQQMQTFQQQQQLSSNIQSDFYETYSELNTPEIRQVVQMMAPQVMQELGVGNWSPVLRDALAAKVKGMLRMGQVAPAAPAAPAQPAQFQPGSRGPVVDPNNVTSQILDMMM